MVWAVLAMMMVGMGFLGVLTAVPFNRWRFVVADRTVEVWNYGFTERIAVDGQVLHHTRVGGDYLSHAIHAVPMRSGEPLVVRIASAHFAIRCLAHIGDRIVFDSLADPDGAHDIDDPRWPEAHARLAALEASSEYADSAETLRRILRPRFEALVKARALAEAHGGATLAEAVALYEQQVEEALGLVHDLYEVAHPPDRSSASTPRTSTMRSAERAQVDKVSSTVTGNP